MIAKNLILLSDQGTSVSTEAWIAGVSLFIAVLALASSIWSARSQIKHNQLSAKPHLAVATGSLKYILMLTNHGPGVAGIETYTATLGGKSYNLLDPTEVEDFTQDLCEGFSNPPTCEYEILSRGDYLAAGASSRTIVPEEPLHQSDRDILVDRLFRLRIEVKTTCVYGFQHSSTSLEREVDPT